MNELDAFLAECRQKLDAATPGLWTINHHGYIQSPTGMVFVGQTKNWPNNLEFTAHAHNTYDTLLKMVEIARDALEFYDWSEPSHECTKALKELNRLAVEVKNA